MFHVHKIYEYVKNITLVPPCMSGEIISTRVSTFNEEGTFIISGNGKIGCPCT